MNRSTINRKSLVVVQLQHDISSKSLKTRAISEILAKSLYQHSDERLTLSQLLSKAAGLAGLTSIQESLGREGLKWLKNNGWAEENNGKWRLTEDGKKNIESRHQESEQRINLLLDKYFGNSVERSSLKAWFLDASVEFFSVFGEIISKALLRDQVALPSRSELERVLEHSVDSAGLSAHKRILVGGFNEFQNDIDPKAEAQKMSFAVATLSARIVAAATGPDPISLPEFENSRLFLDTNVLLLQGLEAHNMAPTFAALSKALDSIGAKLYIIRPTKDEYENVVARKRAEIMKAVRSGVSLDVLAKSGDPFLRTPVQYGAKTEDDFIRFFDTISQAPITIGTIPITLEEFPELQEVISKEVNDPRKQSEIIAEWKKLRGRGKNPILARHDASLNAAALFFRREGNKCWVISRDKSMLNLSRRWHEKEGLPAWVYLEALVELLAVYGAGPNYKPEQFAPLLGALITSDVQDTFAGFVAEDLGELADLDSRVFELSDDEVIDFANTLHQIKFAGEDDPAELQLHIKRTFQGRRLDDNRAAESARAESRAKQQKLELIQEIAVANLAHEMEPNIVWERRKKALKVLLPYLVAGVVLLGASWYVWSHDKDKALLITFVLALGIDILLPIFKVFNKEQVSVREEAKERARAKMLTNID